MGVVKSNLNIGNNLTINTEQDTNIIGSNINVKKDININTKDGDVNINMQNKIIFLYKK